MRGDWQLEREDVGTDEMFIVEGLQRTLGRIGGDSAIAELRMWLASDAVVYVRTSAVTALAAADDRDSISAIAAFFHELKPDRDLARHAVLKALGELKADEHVPLIREAMSARPAIAPGETQTIEVGVAALAAIDSDEAWQTITDLCHDADPLRRQTVVRALQSAPGSRTFTQLVVALEDNDATVREAAYWSLLRIEPQLAKAAPPPWNEATEQKIRTAVKALPTPPPTKSEPTQP